MNNEIRSQSPEFFAPHKEEGPVRIPGVIEERPRTLPLIEDILVKAGYEEAAQAVKNSKGYTIGEIPQIKSWADLLDDAGMPDAGSAVRKTTDQLTHDYISEAELKPFMLSPQEIDALYESSFEKRANGDEGEAKKIFSESGKEMNDRLSSTETPITNNDVNNATDGEEKESGEPIPPGARFVEGDDAFEATSVNPDSIEARLLDAVTKLRGEFEHAVKDANVALSKGDVRGAITAATKLLEQAENTGLKDLPKAIKEKYADVKSTLVMAVLEKNQTAQEKLYKLAVDGADFIPIFGPAKMMAEATMGKTLGGEDLKGWKRFLHGTEGLVFTAVDLTGFGAVATKIAKAGKHSMLAAKLVTRSAALMRVLKVPRSIYRPIFNTGRYLVRHPRLGTAATYGVKAMIARRKRRLKDVLNTKESDKKGVSGRAGMELDAWA